MFVATGFMMLRIAAKVDYEAGGAAGLKGIGWEGVLIVWVAIKERKLSYHNPKTI